MVNNHELSHAAYIMYVDGFANHACLMGYHGRLSVTGLARVLQIASGL